MIIDIYNYKIIFSIQFYVIFLPMKFNETKF